MPKAPKPRKLSPAEARALAAQLQKDLTDLQARVSGGGRRWKPTIPYSERGPSKVKRIPITDELRRKYEAM